MRVAGGFKKPVSKYLMARGMGLCVLFFVILLSLSGCIAWKGLIVDYSDNQLPQGGLALVHLNKTSTGKTPVSGAFNGGETLIVESVDGPWAIIAADLESKPGAYHIIFSEGGKEVSSEIRVTSGDFGTDRITLPSNMVEFDEAALLRIDREKKILEKALGASAKRRLWTRTFVMPITGRISGAFGERRILNGAPRSPHGGLDIAAPGGTPVRASGGGRVAFTGNFFFYGNFVLVDHGLGLFTLYAHLRSINVKKGEIVKAGQTLGLVGATGRATGPHLHFAVMVGRARVSPQGFIDLTARLERLMAGAELKSGGAVQEK